MINSMGKIKQELSFNKKQNRSYKFSGQEMYILLRIALVAITDKS